MSDYTESDKAQDIHILHSMGYAQELERRMSSFSNFAISFSIICILSGGINSLAQATAGAGGAAIGIGWPLGCVISGVFALGMAQIASAYPTAGGLYHWGSILGNRFTGWLTAWFNLIGLVTVLGAINVGTWGFFSGSLAGWFGINVDTTTAQGFANQIIFVAVITGLQALINHLGIKLTAKLTDLSGYLIFITAIALTVVCLIGVKSWDISRIWTFTNYSGLPAGDAAVWPKTGDMWYIFALSLLLPIYTITGYDASAHTSEETVKASESVPKGMVSSVWWASLFGYIMLLAFLLAIPDMHEAANQGWNVFFWTLNSITNPIIANLLYLAIFIAQFICGLATVTSVSRMMYAFARDGGLPFSKALASVSPRYRTPSIAIWIGAILSVLFVWGASLVTIGGSSAYTIVVSCTVIFLFLSFIIPIALGMKAIGTAKWPTMGPWNMGIGLYKLVGLLALVAMAAIFVIGVQPPNQWALYITVGFIVLTAVIWLLFEQRRFKGPPIGEEVARRQAEIAAAEKALGEV
ncbi:amino acid permease [Allorhizobium sp. BGMRC 0089]|uniref:amino acid permease n=1 Tax=Allorhizobium sonneratiae TaxID=2934936 RepID=UPI0020341152|nr:amino acid permease [Allorhizobium sonneratiae]MCM2294168.1 amino acid permease [Allorhizobium sonneratiae]